MQLLIDTALITHAILALSGLMAHSKIRARRKYAHDHFRKCYG